MIPETELQFKAVRSGGPGGQHANKTASKVEVRWNVEQSQAFSDLQKTKIQAKLAARINALGELFLSSESERSQLQNKQEVVARLNDLVSSALLPEKKRLATRVPRVSKEKRLHNKRMMSQKKQSRQVPGLDE